MWNFNTSSVTIFVVVFFVKLMFSYSCRNYGPLPDPSGYYDNHVWPAYLRDKKVAESLINPPVRKLLPTSIHIIYTMTYIHTDVYTRMPSLLVT